MNKYEGKTNIAAFYIINNMIWNWDNEMITHFSEKC